MTMLKLRGRRSYCLLSLLVAALLIVSLPFTAIAAEKTIIVFDDYISPDEIDINVGDTVVWTNGGRVPNIIEPDQAKGGCSEPGGLHAIIEPGQSYSFTFTAPMLCYYTVRHLQYPISI
jgi:plastocyanin